jgi:CHAD domain-containing protein
LHRIRIKIKRLRYALEFFRQALTIKLPINDILCLQKNMGLLNDARISKQLLMPIIKKMPVAAEKSLIDQFNAWEDNLTKQTLKLMQPSWKKLRRKNSV